MPRPPCARFGIALLIPLVIACGPRREAGTTPGAVKPAPGAAKPTPERPGPKPDTDVPDPAKIHNIQLSGDTPITVPGTGLVLRISASSAKIGAPVSAVNVLVRDGDRLAEAAWGIEEGKFDNSWRPIAGRFWHPDHEAYEEGAIPGWELRLVSLDEFHANGAPETITVELRRARP
mgnify:CR=1 FL=1